jgi:hypothetical protein
MTAPSRTRSGALAGARTLAEAIEMALRDTMRTPDGAVPPVAILWTDPKRQWEALVAKLRAVLPPLHALGDYQPVARSGPAIWLRCVVDGAVSTVPRDPALAPVLYLPGVSAAELRDAASCPIAFQPLVELLYRGCVFCQRSGRDWTLEAFLGSNEGLGLDLALDALTRDALVRALPLLFDAPLAGLRDRRLEAEDFDRLAVTDARRDLLRWMDSEEAFRAGGEASRFRSFCAVVRSEFQFDPEKQSPADAAAALAEGRGRWNEVWERFREAPRLYPGVGELLRSIALPLLAHGGDRDPKANADAEAKLRGELAKAAGLPQGDAIARVVALNSEHSERREWVWAELGESPLAVALEPLARLAQRAQEPIGGAALADAIGAYTSRGWQCDRAALEALRASQRPADVDLLGAVVRAIYLPWLEMSARHFQALITANEGAARSGAAGTPPSAGECVLFADGLRFDVAAVVAERLSSRGCRVKSGSRLAPIPTVTATAKPLAAGSVGQLEGGDEAETFEPRLKEGGAPWNAKRQRDLLEQSRVDVLGDESRPPAPGAVGGWVETGQLDELGHKLGTRLAWEVEREVEQLAARVEALLDAGWLRVRIVTDHGWLLLPGGLPRVELPRSVVASRWARCASVRGASQPSLSTLGWYWNPDARIVCPPGVACFAQGYEYAHGGVSPQESIVPELVVERERAARVARIETVAWRGMRCRVHVEANDPSLRVDLRLNWKQSETSIVAAVKEIGAGREASLAVADDAHEGAAATIVVLDGTGAVLDRKNTTVGESV